MFRREHKLSIKLQYKSTVFAVDIPDSATYGELRLEAASRINIPANTFVLKFRGREKADSERLVTSGLKNGSCVIVQETAVHEAIRGPFGGSQPPQGASTPAQYPQSRPLNHQHSHLNPQALPFAPGEVQGRVPAVNGNSHGQRNSRGDDHSLQQNEVHGARYPQTGFIAGGQAGSLAQQQRSSQTGVPTSWEGQFSSSDGAPKPGPHMPQQQQHRADHFAANIEADRRQKRQMYDQHQQMQQAETYGQRQQQETPQGDSRKQKRFVGPQPQLSLEEELLAKVAVQERDMDAFAQQVDDYTLGNGDSADREGAIKQKLILTELLTRVMLALDAVRPSDGGETPQTVRTARKAAIIRAQKLVDRVEATSAANAATAR